jgi:ATP-binding cassette subfamily B protein
MAERSTSVLASYSRLLVTYVGRDWPRVLVLGVLLLATIGLQLANPLLIGHFIDEAIGGAQPGPLIRIALLILGAAVLAQAVELIEVVVAENLSMLATNRLRSALTMHCLRLDHRFHNTHTTGELIERIDGDVDALGNFFSRFVVYLLGNVLLLACTVVYLALNYWWLGVAAFLVCMIVLAVVISVRNVSVPSWGAARRSAADLSGFVEERLGGAEDLRANGAIAHTLDALDGFGRVLLGLQRRASVTSSLTGSSSRLLFTIANAAVLGVIITLVHGDTLTLGGAYVIYRLTSLLMQPVEEINRQAQDFQQATASIRRVQELLDTPITLSDGARQTAPDTPLSLRFDGVTFGYDESNPVLRDLNLTVPAGRVLGVVGRTGSGKSTLARLLFRFYDPQRGAIELGGVANTEYSLAALRRSIGFVTQDVELFRASLRDNLTLFDGSIPDETIIALLTELGIADWYARMPEGLDTPLDARSSLSAGEAQLVALVRVFLKDPAVVVLDEASALLDPATERGLQTALNRLVSGRTAVVIAHHLRTLDFVDDIVVLEEGRVVEHGPRSALAADPQSRFGTMLRAGSMEVSA